MQIDYTALPLTGEKVIPAEYLDFLGHMNVMWYTHLFNEATFAFYDSFGFGVDYHTNSGAGSMALTQHTNYLREVRAGDRVTIRTRMLGYSQKRFHYIHFMLKGDARLSATMEILGIHTDMSTRRASPLPPGVTAAFDALLAAHEKLDWQPPLSGAVAP